MPLDATASLELTRAVSPAINKLGGAFYFDKATLERGKELGLDGFRFYMLGRGGLLGDVDASVVHSAFGYFHPAVVERIWNSARERLAPRLAAQEHLGCCAEWGRATLGDADGLDDFNAAAEDVIDGIDGAGLTLFAAIAREPRPADAAGRAAHNIAVLREHRGSVHLACVVAASLPTEIAHAIRRPDDVELFGWPDLAATQDQRAALDRAEAQTDEVVARAFAALEPASADALRSVVGWV